MSNNINDILKLINKAVVDNYSINVWVPSLTGTDVTSISFKPISITQQKDLLNTAVIQDIYNTNFIKTFFKILKSNYLSEDVFPLNQLNILDKIVILLSLRANINSIYGDVNLNNIIKNIQGYDFSIFAAQSLESDNIKLHCALPSMYTEFLCEEERELVELNTIDDQIQHVVSETIINELSKFCHQIIIDNRSIMLEQFSFSERKAMISQLPAFLLENALNFIINYRKHVEGLLTLKKDNKEDEELLQLNGIFFSTV